MQWFGPYLVLKWQILSELHKLCFSFALKRRALIIPNEFQHLYFFPLCSAQQQLHFNHPSAPSCTMKNPDHLTQRSLKKLLLDIDGKKNQTTTGAEAYKSSLNFYHELWVLHVKCQPFFTCHVGSFQIRIYCCQFVDNSTTLH